MLAKFWTRQNPRKVDCLTEERPDWLYDAVVAAHQGDFPNDWIYSECRAACEAIDDGSLSSDDDVHEYADSRVDVYTHDLASWYADMCSSTTYATAEEEAHDLGAIDGEAIDHRLKIVQYVALSYIARTILDAYQNEGS